MNLIEKELSEEFTRILNANNPHAPQNISRYSNKENTFKTVANMEHVSFHFEFDGCVISPNNLCISFDNDSYLLLPCCFY